MVFEVVESPLPVPAVGLEPLVELGERLRAEPIEAALAVGASIDQSGLLQHPQVLGDRWLTQLQTLDQVADRLLAVAEQIEDIDPMGLAEGLECARAAHRVILPSRYISVKAYTSVKTYRAPERKCDPALATRLRGGAWNDAAVLGEAIGGLLPAAVAVALSPIPIVGVVLVLGTPRARTAGTAFALGWVCGLAALSTLVVVVLGSGVDSGTEEGIEWVKVAIGVAFLAMAAGKWRSRPSPGEEAKMPSWMDSIAAITAPRAAALGAALAGANPKNLALTLAASASISELGLDAADTALAVLAFVLIGSATVAGSVLFYLLSPRRAERPLAAIGEFMAANSAVIMMVVLLLLGAKLLGDGLGGLAAL